MSTQLEHALSYAEEHHQRFVTNLQEFLRIPSISSEPEHAADVLRAAEWLPDDNLHGPNEKIYLPTWRRGIEVLIRYLSALA